MSGIDKVLNTPPIAIATASLLGMSLPEWAAIITIVYTVLLIYFRLRKEWNKNADQQRRIGEADHDE